MPSRRTALRALAVACATLGCDGGADSLYNMISAPNAFAMSVSSQAKKPTIVLVHGAFADATSFQALITLLQEKH